MNSRSLNRNLKEFPVYALVLVLIYPFFGQILPKVLGFTSFGLGVALAIIWYSFQPTRTRTFSSGTGILWALVGLLAISSLLVGEPYSRVDTIMFSASLVLALILTTSSTWVKPVMKIILSFSAVHLAATVTFYLFPNIYSTLVKPNLFQSAAFALDYKSGLTAHFSTNAMYLSLGFVTSVAFAFAKVDRIWVYRILAICFYGGVLMTTKRGHLVAATVAYAFVFLVSNRRWKVLKLGIQTSFALTVLVLASTFIGAFEATLARFQSSIYSADFAEISTGRNFLWEAAMQGWNKNLLWGNGWSSFQYSWPNGDTSSHAHNQFLNSLFETGLVGTAALVVVLAGSLITALKVKSVADECIVEMDSKLAQAIWALSIQTFLLVYGFTSGELFSASYTFVPYFLAVAATYGLNRPGSSQRLHQSLSFEPKILSLRGNELVSDFSAKKLEIGK